MINLRRSGIYKNIFIIIFALSITIYGVLILKFSSEVAKTTVNAINRCINVIIPAFFGFMVVSNLIVKTNIYTVLSKPFSLFSRYILKLPTEYFSIFIISNIGGYPIGVKTITEMVNEDKMSKQEAENLICSCFCCSPSFIMVIIGIGIFTNSKVGLLIYLSILISNLLISIIIGIGKPVPPKNTAKKKISFSMKILSDSVYSTAKTIFLICIMVIFFAIFNSMLNCTGTIPHIVNTFSDILHCSKNNFTVVVNTIMEISNISDFCKFSYSYIPVMTCLLSFGGICVFAQFVSICNKKYSLNKFYITRPLQITLSCAMSMILFKLFGSTIYISTSNSNIHLRSCKSYISLICLIIMVIALLYKMNNRFLKKNMV